MVEACPRLGLTRLLRVYRKPERRAAHERQGRSHETGGDGGDLPKAAGGGVPATGTPRKPRPNSKGRAATATLRQRAGGRQSGCEAEGEGRSVHGAPNVRATHTATQRP